MRVELTQVIKVSRDKVFQIAADYEGTPQYSTIFTRVQVTQRQGNTVYTETEGMMLGRPRKFTEKHVLTPPTREETEVEDKRWKGKMVTVFELVAEGTRVTWAADIRFKGVWGRLVGLLAKGRMQAVLQRDLRAFAKYVEMQT